jgi:hypothetical protein
MSMFFSFYKKMQIDPRPVAGVFFSISLAFAALPVPVAAQDHGGAGRWFMQSSRDKFDDSERATFALRAQEATTDRLGQPSMPVLGVRCRGGREIELLFQADEILEGRYSVQFRIRIDSGPPEVVTANLAGSHASGFFRAPQALFPRIAAAQSLLIEYLPYRTSAKVAEFRPSGISQYASEVLRYCGISIAR